MGRINNGNWVSQYRKTQGKFQNKQDIEAYLFNKKVNNGNNTQGNNTLNTDDLPNIPAVLDYELNLSRQNSIEPIDGGKAHTPTTQAFLTALTALSVISPNIVSSRKGISTNNQNSLSSTVKSFTEMSKTPVLFDTTSATTPTSQNHDKSKEPTKHNDSQSLIRVKRVVDEENGYFKLPDGIHYIRELDDRSNFENLLVKKYYTKNGINFFELSIWGSDIGCKEVKDIEKMLKDMQRVNLSNNHIISDDVASELGKIIGKNTHAIELILSNSGIGDLKVQAFVAALADSKNIIALNLEDNIITDTGARTLMLWLQKHPEIISFNLYNNHIQSNNTLNEIARIIEQHKTINKGSDTDISIIKSTSFQEDLTTTQEKSTEKSELRIVNVTDNTTTPEETNSNDQATYNIMLVGLLVSTIAGISAAVYAIKRHFCKNTNSEELKTFNHNELALLEILDLSHNNTSVAIDTLKNEETDILGDVIIK